jgi:hypothetical protein
MTGVNDFSSPDGVRHFCKIPYIARWIGIEHYHPFGTHSSDQQVLAQTLNACTLQEQEFFRSPVSLEAVDSLNDP